MKAKLLTSLFVLAVILCVCSCQSKPEDLIIGKWQMTELTTNSPEAENPDVKEFYAEMAKSSESIFNADLTCINTVNSITTKGRWTILADGKQLHIIDDDSGSKSIMTIESITSDCLVLTTKTDDIETKTVYTKVK
ncbi:MAG: lipocalin family protein [Bacteroidales bacterium]|nr:lipocalin family protein [Bacteroidales bacterium]